MIRKSKQESRSSPLKPTRTQITNTVHRHTMDVSHLPPPFYMFKPPNHMLIYPCRSQQQKQFEYAVSIAASPQASERQQANDFLRDVLTNAEQHWPVSLHQRSHLEGRTHHLDVLRPD